MAFYSLVIYAGNGSNRNFTIHFPYLDKSHVKAKIDNAPTTAFSWLTASAIQFNTAPAVGANIEIYRETPLNASPVDFTDGSILLERDLDLLTIFNLYVDQELTDRAARAISAGNQGGNSAGNQAEPQGTAKVSNTDTTLDTLDNKLNVVAPLSKAVKNVGANEKLELSIDLSNYVTKGEVNGGAAANMSGYATLKANNFDGFQTMTGLKVKNTSIPGSAIVTLQSSNDNSRDVQCGVRYTNTSGAISYQHYYTSEKIAWHVLTDGDSTYRWCFEAPFDIATAASLKRNPNSGKDPSYYSFNVGDPYNQSFGAAVNIYGVAANNHSPKLSMYNSNIYHGGLTAYPAEMHLTVPGRYMLKNLNGENYCDINQESAIFFFSRARNNNFQLASDGNIILMRNNVPVWAVNNYLTSDARLKTDIKPLEGSSLEKVKQLAAKTYLWKDDLMDKGEKREIGFLAQEVVKVVPEAVSKVSSGAETLGVAYTQLVPVLVEAVKELSAKVESLEAQLLSKE